MGLQIVAIPWLAVDYLSLSSSALGLIQAAVFLPNLLLLIGGVSADRGRLFGKFLLLLGAYGILHSGLLILLLQDSLSWLSLLLYALLLGCVAAFIQPCKDYLMGSLAESDLQALIAKNQCCQYIGQAIGIGLASLVYTPYLNFLPGLQIVFVVLAMVTFGLFIRAYQGEVIDRSIDKEEQRGLPFLLKGLQVCWDSIVLRSLLVIVAVNGFFHIGFFVVALPVLVKTTYRGDIDLYALLQCLFVLGTITTTVLVIIKGQLDTPGRRVIFCLLYAGLILLGLSAGPTYYGLLFLIYLWGVVVGISATLGRAILQSQVSAEHRGRAISIYQLALFGFAPLGSLFAGFTIDSWDVQYALKIAAIASFVVFAGLFFTRALWDIEAEDTCSTQS